MDNDTPIEVTAGELVSYEARVRAIVCQAKYGEMTGTQAAKAIVTLAQPKMADAGEADRLREALEEALTPSAATKAAYHGEFQFNIEYADEDGNSYWQPHLVPWDQVKEIMAAIMGRARARATLTGSNPAVGGEGHQEKNYG